MTKKTKKLRLQSPKLSPLLIVGFVGGVLYFTYQLTQIAPKSVDINAINTTTRVVDLSLSSPDTQTIVLNLSPNSSRVTAGQFVVSYDPAQLGTASVTLGEFFFTKLGEPTLDNGLLTFAAGVSVESGGNNSSGKAATIKFSKKPSSPTTVFVTKNTTLVGIGYNSNILKNSASITLSPAASPTTNTTIITETPTPNPVGAAQISTNNNPQSMTNDQQSMIQPTPTPKPNLITKLVSSVTKPKAPTPTPMPSITPLSNDDSRTFADTTFGQNPLPSSPAPQAAKESWLVRFLNWLKSQLTNLSSNLE